MSTSKIKPAKRIALLCLALVVSMLITELFVRKVIGYPGNSEKSMVVYRSGGRANYIRYPHSKRFNVEGNNIATLNNYGLSGTDVSSLKDATVVLGTSMVEALQVQAEDVASSCFQRNLERMGLQGNVVNLGSDSHDPYDSWFRLKYFEDYLGLEAKDVVLVLNSDYSTWLPRHPRPLVFERHKDFGREISSSGKRLQMRLRKYSAFLELVVRMIKPYDREAGPGTPVLPEAVVQLNEYSLSQEMVDCLLAFKSAYPRFLVLSITDDLEFNSNLTEFCLEKSIHCKTEYLLKPEYLIDGVGHLNVEGNQALGRSMTQAYIEAFRGE